MTTCVRKIRVARQVELCSGHKHTRAGTPLESNESTSLTGQDKRLKHVPLYLGQSDPNSQVLCSGTRHVSPAAPGKTLSTEPSWGSPSDWVHEPRDATRYKKQR